MWPWFLILAGTLLIVGALIARRRILRDYHAGLARDSRAAVGEDALAPLVDESQPVVPAPALQGRATAEPEPEPESLSPTAQLRAVTADEVPIFVVTASDPATRAVDETAPTELLGPERPAPEPVLPPRPAFARTTNPPPAAAPPE